MSIPLWILIIIGSIFGIVLTGGTVIGLIAVIIFKIYRKLDLEFPYTNKQLFMP